MSDSTTAPDGKIEHREVVSILLFAARPLASKPPRVLLFRRSDQVRTYPRKLGPIAGSIEPSDQNALAAAWRELKEETGLAPDQIDLWRRGPGFEFTDEKALSRPRDTGNPTARTWKIWPFAFRFNDGVKDDHGPAQTPPITIDWEHLSYEWRTVDEILDGQLLDRCVPRLDTTLGQVWIDPESSLHAAYERLRCDHASGARELATKAVESLLELVESDERRHHHAPPVDLAAWWRDFRVKAFHLAFNARPSMAAAISSAIVAALTESKAKISTPTPTVWDDLKTLLRAYLHRRSQISHRVNEHFSTFLTETCRPDRPIRILTLSNSSTVRAALLHALQADDSRHIDLRILESRPLCEGVRLAETLAQAAWAPADPALSTTGIGARLQITVATDASVGLLSQDADLLILGADRISEKGDVSNKTGSLSALLTGRMVTEGAISTLCLSETDKIAPPGAIADHAAEDNDSAEVERGWKRATSPSWDRSVTVRNVYFEWVPAQYVDHYICEDGVLSADQIQHRSRRIADLSRELFAGL